MISLTISCAFSSVSVRFLTGRIHVHRRTVIQSYHSGDKRAAFEDEIIPVWGNGKPFQKPFHDIVAYDDHSLVAVAFGHIAN